MYASHPEDDLRALQIASIRCSLRRTLKMASEFVHLVEIYGRGSVRLMRILKKQALAPSRAEIRIRETIRLEIIELNKEWRPSRILCGIGSVGSSGTQPGS